jgi:serine/threonine-protein kinase HipA
MKTLYVYFGRYLAGYLAESDTGYRFQYDAAYLAAPYAYPISLTLPLQAAAYDSPMLFAFFDGLIPEGWLLDLGTQYWKLNPRDRFELLAHLCKETIGAVRILTTPEHA